MYNDRNYEVCGFLNQHKKPCLRIGKCPFHWAKKQQLILARAAGVIPSGPALDSNGSIIQHPPPSEQQSSASAASPPQQHHHSVAAATPSGSFSAPGFPASALKHEVDQTADFAAVNAKPAKSMCCVVFHLLRCVPFSLVSFSSIFILFLFRFRTF